MIDFDKAHLLLDVHSKASGHPKLKDLAAAAMAEREAMVAKPAPTKEPVEEPELPIETKGRRV